MSCRRITDDPTATQRQQYSCGCHDTPAPVKLSTRSAGETMALLTTFLDFYVLYSYLCLSVLMPRKMYQDDVTVFTRNLSIFAGNLLNISLAIPLPVPSPLPVNESLPK